MCAHDALISPSVCCSSFFGNSAETLAKLSETCARRGMLLQIHSNEHFSEVHDCVLRFGKRPVELLHELGVLGQHVLLHHTTLVSEPEIELLFETNTAARYNPLATVWKGNAVMPALRYAQRGIRFGVGSDTTSADAFRNLLMAEACQQEYALPVADFSCGAAWTWEDAATSIGAAATGGGTDRGSVSPGMAADFLVLDMQRPECMPSHDFEWELVRYYNRDQVAAVVIAGAPVMVSGQPVGWSTDEMVVQGMVSAEKICSQPDIERCHGPSRLYRKSPSVT